MQTKHKIIAAVIVLALTAGAVYGYNYYSTQKDLINQYCYDLVGWRVVTLNGSNIQVEVDLYIKNPSAFSIVISGYNLDVLIDDTLAANVFSAESATIPAMGDLVLPIFVDIPKNKIGTLLPMMLSITSRTLNIKGVANVSKGFINISKDINISMPISSLTSGGSSNKCSAA